MSFFKAGNQISTRELAEKCEKQEAQLIKTKTRLANLVAAYRSLQDEKTTLEESLAALAGSSEPSVKPVSDSENGENSSEDNPSEVSHLENEKIARLTSSLAQMSAERAKMQETFQSDRKKMRQEFEEKISTLKNDYNEATHTQQKYLEELTEYKNKSKDTIISMEADTSASKIANRELQRQLYAERKKNDELKKTLTETKEQTKQLSKQATDRSKQEASDSAETISKQFDEKLEQAKKKITEKNSEIKVIKTRANDKISDLSKANQELQKTVDELRNSLKERTSFNELKVSELEDRIAGVTNLCSELEREKSVQVQKNLAHKDLIEQLRESQNFDTTTEVQDDKQDYFRLFIQAQDDIKQLAIDLEETKIKLVRKEEKSAPPQQVGRTDELEEEIRSLKASLVTSKRKTESLQVKLASTAHEQELQIESIRICGEQQQAAAEARANDKIAEFEAELAQMRERSQKILGDKDSEIEILRRQNEVDITEVDSVGQLMQNGDANIDTALIMYTEQLARKDVEINTHRTRRNDLENRIRGLQEKLAESYEEVQSYKEKIQAEERDKSPASKEYMRNLVVQFLAAPEGTKKKSMLSALETILQFSKTDVQVMKKQFTR